MQDSIRNDKQIRVKNAVAAGFGDTISSDIVDNQGFETVEYDVVFGAIAAGGSGNVHLQHGDDPALADAADVLGSLIAVDDVQDNKIVRIQILKPLKRYSRVQVVRAVANVTIDAIIAELEVAKHVPVTQHTTIVSPIKELASPLSGTP